LIYRLLERRRQKRDEPILEDARALASLRLEQWLEDSQISPTVSTIRTTL